MKKWTPMLVGLCLCVGESPAGAQSALPVSPMGITLGLALLSLAAFFLMMMTSFVKISVVLSILRNAIGTQQIPPAPVVTGFALILTFFVMSPVFTEAAREAGFQSGRPLPVLASAEDYLGAFERAREPFRRFLGRHCHKADLVTFYELANQMQGLPAGSRTLATDRFQVLAPAFVTSQLVEGFLIGFLIYLPFLVIDLVVANILMAMGMTMMSPTTISLPIKLIFFVLMNGWLSLVHVLVIDYLPRVS